MTAKASCCRSAQNIDLALELDGSKVCVQDGTTTQLNLADYFRANNMKYQEMKFAKLDEVVKAYESGQCDTFTADVSQLYALRLNLAKPADHTILPDVISKEPLAPVVRQRDDDWMMIVKWTLYAMINAEELGITSKNIDEALKSKKPDVMRLVGTEGAYGEELGLTKDWAVRIIRHVGNYGEVYERNVGGGSKLGHSARAQSALERRRHPVRAADQVILMLSSPGLTGRPVSGARLLCGPIKPVTTLLMSHAPRAALILAQLVGGKIGFAEHFLRNRHCRVTICMGWILPMPARLWQVCPFGCMRKADSD